LTWYGLQTSVIPTRKVTVTLLTDPENQSIYTAMHAEPMVIA